MSKTLELAYERALKSKYTFRDNNTIEVEDAAILWPDFEGKVTEYHTKLGEKRSFNLVLNDQMVDALKEIEERTKSQSENKKGARFKIREKAINANDPKSKVVHYINVKVNMESVVPPSITLFTEYKGKRSRQTLGVSNVGILDRTDIKSADLVLNCYNGRKHPDQLTAYLKKLYVIQEPDVEFGGKYDDWEDVNNEPDEVVNPATGDPVND